MSLYDECSVSIQVKNHSLGGKVGWNGKASSYSLTDYCALHPNIVENQLINILQKSFVTTSSSSSVVAMGSNAIPTSCTDYTIPMMLVSPSGS